MHVSPTASIASNNVSRVADISTDVQRQGLAISITFITVLGILGWIGQRKWVPAISLAVQVLTMDVSGEFLDPTTSFRW